MEDAIWRAFVSLGIPGLALGVLYMLFRRFHWRVAEVPPTWSGPILVLFMLISGGIVYFALSKWAPNASEKGAQPSTIIPAGAPSTAGDSQRPSAGAGAPDNASWKRAWLAIEDHHRLCFGHHGHFGSYAPTVTNRAELLKTLNRVDVSMDQRLSTARNKIIKLIREAPKDDDKQEDLDASFDMIYTDEIHDAIKDLEFEIRDAAVAHGVEVQVLPESSLPC